MGRFALPCVVWVTDATRARLREIASLRDSPVERVGGKLLDAACASYVSTGPSPEAKVAQPEPVVESGGRMRVHQRTVAQAKWTAQRWHHRDKGST
ncbi:hypothetical protein [Paraburkholderia nodosa]|uniref:hypothetical protein n=1 Tax=Paraburkholderia nodosa TaxID=392320 RepID=UPI00047F02DA|nr:hypothetical protein [Paraburkholderia nodosa]